MANKEINQEIRENWFKDHVATFEKLNDRVSTLSWGKPNSSFYYIRYVFDGCKLYVSGDLGEAVFCLTEKASIESMSKHYDVYYFHGKLSALSEDKYSFDEDKAIERIKYEIEETKENRDIDEDGLQEKTERNMHINSYISVLNRLMEESKSCCNKSNWDYVVNQVYDDLTNYDCDVYEWIFSAGDVVPNSVRAYLIGIKMACEQLKNKQKNIK